MTDQRPAEADQLDGGWASSAQGWLDLIDRGEPNRELLLDPVVLEQCGDVTGLRVLDLGCGEGRFCRMLAGRGAFPVGLDSTETLISVARERLPSGDHVRATASSLPFAPDTFGLVVSYLSMIDIPDFRRAIVEGARVLRPGGRFVVANLGFVTASAGWVRDDAGNRLYQPIDRYAEERPIELEWAGMRIVNWHRPLAAYMQASLGAGLTLRSFLEPVPQTERLIDDPRFEDWYRVPLFNVMTWEKMQ